MIITIIEHPQLKLYNLKPQTFKHVEIINVSDKPIYDISMERSWRSQILIITMIEHPQLKTYHLKPQPLKDVEILKVQNITKFDTSLERS